MVADAGAYFQHRSTGEIEVERRKVLETTLIVPKIVKGPEGEVGCLQNPVVGPRATRTWIGRHGVHGASPVNWIDFALNPLDAEAFRRFAALPRFPHGHIRRFDVASGAVGVEQRMRQPVCGKSISIFLEK
jgi:hypothetical protein